MPGLYATPGEGPWTESARRAMGCSGSFRARLRAEAEDRGDGSGFGLKLTRDGGGGDAEQLQQEHGSPGPGHAGGSRGGQRRTAEQSGLEPSHRARRGRARR